jgi:threonine aldolase
MTNERPSGPIDLRSDTVTKPTPAMRRAMYEAEVGDDVFGDDPTVNALQERAAELFGKEAGLFVASGTQGNLVSQLAHLGRGYETIGGATCHIVTWEQAGHAAVVGAAVRQLQEKADGTFDLHELEEAFRDPTDSHQPVTGMVAIENTHATSMGQPLSIEYTRTVADVAHRHGVPLHIDGARFFNATVALSVKPADLAGPADSLTFCLSKGLACPVGSVVVGSKEFIGRAHRGRKVVGGGMRQVGILAAAAEFALDHLVDRLAEDHARAKRLAQAVAALPGCEVDVVNVETNIVFVTRPRRDAPKLEEKLRRQHVWTSALAPDRLRFVTHRDVGDADVVQAIAAMERATRELAA